MHFEYAAESTAVVRRPPRVLPQHRHLVPGRLPPIPPNLRREAHSQLVRPQRFQDLCAPFRLHRALLSGRPREHGLRQPGGQDGLDRSPLEHLPLEGLPPEILRVGSVAQRHLPLPGRNRHLSPRNTVLPRGRPPLLRPAGQKGRPRVHISPEGKKGQKPEVLAEEVEARHSQLRSDHIRRAVLRAGERDGALRLSGLPAKDEPVAAVIVQQTISSLEEAAPREEPQDTAKGGVLLVLYLQAAKDSR
jgi:hypothetical protein